jgi:hypothetical protein
MRRLFLLLPLLAACTTEAPVDGPTWHQDVAPLVSASCGGCHSPGKIAPFDLVTYADAAPIADWIAETVEARTMPPWGAQDTDECEPTLGWKDDIRLTDAEIAVFREWADTGAQEGDEATAAPLPEPPSTSLERVDQVLTPMKPWQVTGDDDQFRCIVMDPELTENGKLVGLQVNPGNDDVVHHVLVFSTEADDAAEVDDLARDEGSFGCGAGDPLPVGGELIAAWAPGAQPMRTPAGTGAIVEAGSRIVAQIHYHPTGAATDPDETTFDLMWSQETGVRRSFLTLLGNEGSSPELQPGPNDEGDPEFVIPAGATGHTETIIYEDLDTGGTPLRIFAAGTHMHWVGRDMKIVLRHADGTEECLVHTPAWDFNWQRWYDYDGTMNELPLVVPGETLILRCTYDNTLDNPFVREALEEQGLTEPVDVRLGDETLDEMCLAVLGLTVEI